jgi:hypothetical protein
MPPACAATGPLLRHPRCTPPVRIRPPSRASPASTRCPDPHPPLPHPASTSKGSCRASVLFCYRQKLTTCRMFRLYGESLNCRGSSLFTDNKTRSYFHRHLLSLLEYTEPIGSNRLFISRFRTQGSRTRLRLMFTVSLSTGKQLRHVITFLAR